MQAVLLGSIRQGKRVLQRLNGPDVPPPGAYTVDRSNSGASLNGSIDMLNFVLTCGWLTAGSVLLSALHLLSAVCPDPFLILHPTAGYLFSNLDCPLCKPAGRPKATL